MRKNKKQRLDQHILKIDQSEIKVSFEELFYDLIFIIVISKISMLLVESNNISGFTFIAVIGLFFAMVWSWLFRLIHNNQVHIMSNKFGSRVANLKNITYLEILLIILIIHNFNEITINFIISVLAVVLLVTTLTMTQVRTFLKDYFADDRESLRKIIMKARSRNISLINIDYICERYGVIIILFLGEILATIFTNIESTTRLLFVVIMVIIMFNEISNLLKMIPLRLIESQNRPKLYLSLRSNFISILVTLLALIVSIDYSSHHHHLYGLIIFGILVVYQFIVYRLKQVFEFDHSIFRLCYFIVISLLVIFTPMNILLLNILLLALPIVWNVYIIKKLSQ